MTPWNLVGMAKIKGLNVIALTDHNAAQNLPQAMEAGREYGVTVVPGMEISSKEDVHILGYFPTLEAALKAGEEIYAHLPEISNNPGLFGNQLIIGPGDEISGTLDKLLINATDLSVDQVCRLVEGYGGLAVPAHINRGTNGMIGALGLMPFLPQFPLVEVYPGIDCPAYAVKGRKQLHSSDAHRLEVIQEPIYSLETDGEELSNVFEALKAKTIL